MATTAAAAAAVATTAAFAGRIAMAGAASAPSSARRLGSPRRGGANAGRCGPSHQRRAPTLATMAAAMRRPCARRRVVADARTDRQVRSCTVRDARRAAAPRPTRRPRPAVRAATAPRHPAVLVVDTPSPTARRERPDTRGRRRDQPVSGGDRPPV